MEARPLLLTKLHPPPRRAQTVERDRLVDRLCAASGTKLTVVAAPAGSGKTTLLGAWREVESATRPIAWLTLDEGDNDPVVLWSYVLEALTRALPTLRVSPTPERVGGSRLISVVLPALVNELVALGETALVLDDFHRLSSGPTRESIAWFIDHAPPTFQLVLATRSEPALPLGALRGHAELLELRAGELAFTRGEAETLLNDRLGLGLEPASVDRLVERTEGWPAGLYLAALSLQGVEDRDGFVGRYGGANRHVIDFLVNEVLETHDPATQTLMLRCSILERMCGALCDAVLEVEGADRVLHELSRANLFLVPLDDRGHWYRFHHLFAQLLRLELGHRDPGLTPTLHRRACAWHRDSGSVEEAIEHALAAGTFDQAAELIAGSWAEYVDASRYATVLRWLERFPQELRRADAELLLVAAWVHSLCGERGAAIDATAAVERIGGLQEGPLPDGFSSVEGSLATLRGAIAWGDNGSGLRNARRAIELEGPGSPWRALACCTLGLRLYASGEPAEADQWLAESAELAMGSRRWFIAVHALAYRSLVAGDREQLDLQMLLADQAVKLVHEHRAEDVDGGEVFLALGAALAARGRLEEALPQLERGAAVLRSMGHPMGVALALIHQARLFRAMGLHEAAQSVIEEARAEVSACPDPGILEEWLAALERPTPTRRAAGSEALSERELVILRMLGGTLSERDIGRELYLSHNTIHSHTRSIYRKLGVSSRAEAVTRARELGFIRRDHARP